MSKKIISIILTLLFVAVLAQRAFGKTYHQADTIQQFRISFAHYSRQSLHKLLLRSEHHGIFVEDTLQLQSDRYRARLLKIVNDSLLYDGDALNDTIVILDDIYTPCCSELFVITPRSIVNKVSLGENTTISIYPNNQSEVRRIVEDHIDVYCNFETWPRSIASELIIKDGTIVQAISFLYSFLIGFDAQDMASAKISELGVSFKHNWAHDIEKGDFRVSAPFKKHLPLFITQRDSRISSVSPFPVANNLNPPDTIKITF